MFGILWVLFIWFSEYYVGHISICWLVGGVVFMGVVIVVVLIIM